MRVIVVAQAVLLVAALVALGSLWSAAGAVLVGGILFAGLLELWS